MKHRVAIIIFVLAFATLGARGQQKPDTKTSNAQTAQPNIPLPILGSGTANHLVRFTGTHSVGDSGLTEDSNGLSTNESVTVGNFTALVSTPRSISVHGLNTTPDGDTQDGFFHAIGLFGETTSPTSAAVVGIGNSTSGDPFGVFGSTASVDRGIGVLGQAVASGGGGIGVLGQALSGQGFAGVFNHMASSGYPIALFGYSGSSDGGEGVHGRTNGTTGLGIGVNGDTFSHDGFGGSFTNFAGGNILRGVNNATVVFRVDGNGTVFANGGLQPGGADFAESVAVTGDHRKYTAGDLLVIDAAADRQLALAQEPYSTLVAGIYSTKPGMLGTTHKAADVAATDEIPLAIVGIVPCKVTTENGAIRPGDLLVTSSIPGHAMKGTDRQKMLGAVVGKALEPLDKGSGVIQVLVTLQ